MSEQIHSCWQSEETNNLLLAELEKWKNLHDEESKEIDQIRARCEKLEKVLRRYGWGPNGEILNGGCYARDALNHEIKTKETPAK